MFIVGVLSWWYGAGWRQRVLSAREHIVSAYDYFSIDLLVRTLFAPFRQIAAGSVRGPLGVQMRAWFDQLISRIIGTIVRLMMIIAGVLSLMVFSLFYGIAIVTWGVVPAVPFLGIILALTGWVPWPN